MALFTLPQEPIDTSEDFVVRESTGLNAIYAVVSWIFFFSILSLSGFGLIFRCFMAITMGSTAVVSTYKVLKHPECMRINKAGIFYYGRLLTNWDNLVSARLTQGGVAGDEDEFKGQYRTSDNFLLVLEYSHEDGGDVYRRIVKLTNTQDKSEEEILNAIRCFSNKAEG